MKPDPLEGTRIRDWQIVRRLAVGGMGVVYEAVHTGIGRKAALKVLAEEFAGEPEYVDRLGAEARALAAIAHRGVVQVFDAGALPDGRPWLAMELLQGETLQALLKRGRPPLERAIEVLDQLLSALAAAHAGGLIHRDVKPANLFVVSRPFEPPFVKVMDFGLVRRAAPGAQVAQTYQDRFVGTPGYMAPEQAMGKAVGPQTDLYAVGAVAYELLTGSAPFAHADPLQLARLHLEAKAPRPSKLNPEVPPELDRWVSALLEKDPAQRPADADGVRRELLRTMGFRAGATPAVPLEYPTGPLPDPAPGWATTIPDLPLLVPAHTAAQTRANRPALAVEATDADRTTLMPPHVPGESRPSLSVPPGLAASLGGRPALAPPRGLGATVPDRPPLAPVPRDRRARRWPWVILSVGLLAVFAWLLRGRGIF